MGEFDPLSMEEREPDEAPRGDGTRVMRALVVGITDYDDPDLSLKMEFSSAAAAHMAASLEGRGYLVRQLHDEQNSHGRPTLAAVKRELRAIMKAADEDDTVLFYFVGHGVLERKRGVLLLADARARRKRYVEGALQVTELLRLLRGRPRFTVVLLDACHMGLALDPGTSDSTAAVNEREGAGGFALLSGSTSDDLTQDTTRGKIKGGAFTAALIAGLDGGVVDPDGGVRFSSLARFVQQHVDKWKKSAEGREINATQKAVVRLEVADVQVVPAPRDYRDLTPQLTSRFSCAGFSDDGRSLVTGGDDRKVRVWDAVACTEWRTPLTVASDLISVAFSDSSARVLAVCRDGATHVWSLLDGSVGAPVRFKPGPRSAKRTGLVNGMAECPSSTRVVATTTGLFVEGVTPDGIIPIARVGRAGTSYNALCTCRLVGGITTGDADGNLHVLAGDYKDPIMALRLDGGVQVLAAGGRDDHRVAAGAGAQTIVWDLLTNDVKPLPGLDGAVTSLAISPDGEVVAAASPDGLVRLFATATGKLKRTLSLGLAAGKQPPAATALCYAPRGDQLFVGYASGRGRRFQL